jgi:hypothetical protein
MDVKSWQIRQRLPDQTVIDGFDIQRQRRAERRMKPLREFPCLY